MPFVVYTHSYCESLTLLYLLELDKFANLYAIDLNMKKIHFGLP